jgi:glycosyltransferase involved in cell wall biosynthesis
MSGSRQRSLYFLTTGDPEDPELFSGSARNAFHAIRRIHPDIHPIRRPVAASVELAAKALRQGPAFVPDLLRSPAVNRRQASRILRKINADDAALVSVINSPLLAHLSPHIPTLYISDATFACWARVFAGYGAVSRLDRRWAEWAESTALQHAVHMSFSSPWAARSAVDDYQVDPRRVSVIPWGSNLRAADIPPDQERVPSECRLLTVGVDWRRKGFDISCEVLAHLQDWGIPATLDIVGPRLPKAIRPSRSVTQHGVLSRDADGGSHRLAELYATSAYFLLPTRADCTPMVFAEANAVGLPCVSWNVGGVTGVVTDGVNGLITDPSAGARGLAEAIRESWSDPARYARLRVSARTTFESTLNWDAWASRLAPEIDRLRLP